MPWNQATWHTVSLSNIHVLINNCHWPFPSTIVYVKQQVSCHFTSTTKNCVNSLTSNSTWGTKHLKWGSCISGGETQCANLPLLNHHYNVGILRCWFHKDLPCYVGHSLINKTDSRQVWNRLKWNSQYTHMTVPCFEKVHPRCYHATHPWHNHCIRIKHV